MVSHEPANSASKDGGSDCIAFLQWALPHIDLRWQGFRKVRRQVCKRLKRRIQDLGLSDFASYRKRLESDPGEWRAFDQCCHITISRFFRDRGVFEVLRRRVLPELAARMQREQRGVDAWSAGCASGEEPYTLKILWDLEIARDHPFVSLSVLATDIDKTMLARAQRGCFEATSLRELPAALAAEAFERSDSLFCVKPRHRQGVVFAFQDLRSDMPDRRFDLILCRYVAFTYFSLPLQRRVLMRMSERLRPNGYFVIGTHEQLPDCVSELVPLAGAPHIFRKV